MQHASSTERGRWMSSDRPRLSPPWWRIPRLPRVVDLRRKQPHLPVAPALAIALSSRGTGGLLSRASLPLQGLFGVESPIIAHCSSFAPLILGHRPSGSRKSSSPGVLVHQAWGFQGAALLVTCTSKSRLKVGT